MKAGRRPAFLLLALLAGVIAWAPGVVRADEAADIARERAAATERYVGRERACRERFVVTSCIDDAKRERRETLDALKARQLVVDENRRHERADARRQSLAEKAADETRRDAERPARSARPASSASSAASGSAGAAGASPVASKKRAPSGRGAAPAKPQATPKPRLTAAERADREARSRKAYEGRQSAAQAHREESVDATLRRMAAKRPASSLPVLASAGSAASASSPASAARAPR